MAFEHDTTHDLSSALRRVLAEGERYGRTSAAARRRVLVEFVSANPNGPITAAHGRGGAIGDTLAALLDWTGNDVSREFYVNDTVGSGQIQTLAQSLFARYRQKLGYSDEIPEDGYHGEYVQKIAQSIVASDGERYVSLTPEAAAPIFQALALQGMREQQTATLTDFGIHYDTWFSEQTLYASGAVEKVLETLRERGFAVEQKGALWLRSTQFGDDKDRVLVRAEGSPTYLAGDLAYHANKLARGFDFLVDVWGADHQNYVARTKAGLAALGYAPSQLQIALYQPIRLIRNGIEERTGKHGENSVTLDELIREVGKDAARFFFLQQPPDTPREFDLDLAYKQSRENPVYAVQHAHARCCAALAQARNTDTDFTDTDFTDTDFTDTDFTDHDFAPPKEAEAALAEKLAAFPGEVQQAAAALAPHRIARYALDLANLLHQWADMRGLPAAAEAEKDAAFSRTRLVLLSATRITLANALTLLGVSAPERMAGGKSPTAA